MQSRLKCHKGVKIHFSTPVGAEHVIAVTVHAGIGLIAALPAAESALSIEPAGFRSSLANFSAGQSCLHPLHHFMPFSARLFSLAFLFASFFERPALTM